MRQFELNAQIAGLLRRRFEALQMDNRRFGQLTGFKSIRVTKLLDGSAGMRLEWVGVVSDALQIDRRYLLLLTVERLHGEKAANVVKELLPPPLTTSERDWLQLIRRSGGDVLASPNDLERRVVSALLAPDTE